MKKVLLAVLMMAVATQASAWGKSRCLNAHRVSRLFHQKTLIKHCHRYIRGRSSAVEPNNKTVTTVEKKWPEYRGQWGDSYFEDWIDTYSNNAWMHG